MLKLVVHKGKLKSKCINDIMWASGCNTPKKPFDPVKSKFTICFFPIANELSFFQS